MYAVLNLLLEPLVIITGILGYVSFMLWRKREVTRRRIATLALAVLALYLYCTPAVAYFLLGGLEWKYPPTTSRPEKLDAIVILSGGIYAPDDIRPKAVLGERTIYRCLRGAELFDKQNPCPIVLSGGKVNGDRPGPTLSQAMSDLITERFGIDKQHILLEDQSRTTHENAVNTCRLLKENDLQRVALVTDATHLHRSTCCFRKQGCDVIPIGCAYRATKFRWELGMFLPTPTAATGSHGAIHEYLGLAWYWFKERI